MSQSKKRKTRESFGAVESLPSGRVRARYVGPDGKRYNAPRTFDNMTDARGWLAMQRVSIDNSTWSPVDAQRTASAKSHADTLAAYATDWLSTRMNRHGEGLRPRTRAEYERLLAGSLSDLTAMRLRMITPDVVRTWYTEQMNSGRKTQTSRAYGLLKSILATAMQDGKINVNPCMIRGAQNASTGRKVTPPTSAELQAILDAITPRYRAAVILAAWGALRYGEVTELRRADVRVIGESTAAVIIIDVSRAVTHTTGHGYTVGKTKSAAGVRSIALPPHVNGYVLDHLKANVGTAADSLLFPAADDVTHLAESTFVKHWYPARNAAKRPDMPFHALRHYGATKFAQTGATLKEIQDRLGHSTVAAAMRYQHSAGRDGELARRMSELASL